jgi:hypothetical protein
MRFGSGDDALAIRDGDCDVVECDLGVTDLHGFRGTDGDVAQGEGKHGGFRQTDDDPGPVAPGGLQVLDQDVVEMGRQARDGCGGDGTIRHGFGVVLADEDGGADAFHRDVFEGKQADVGATVSIGLDADAVVGAVEVDAFDGHALHTAGYLAAD